MIVERSYTVTMKKILLASHGRLAFGLKDTLEIFLGPSESIVAVGAYIDSTDRHVKEIQTFIDSQDQEDSVIFTDIYGGSVNQLVTELVVTSNKNIPIITSMNLPMVLSVALSEEPITAEYVSKLAKDCIPSLVSLQCESEEGGLDEFLE